MKIISISGLDGSGKSTQARLLEEHFIKKGKRVYYFHAIQFSFAQKIEELRLNFRLAFPFPKRHGVKKSKKKEISVTKANRLQIQLRKIFFLIDVFRFSRLKKRLRREKYNYLISDRYFYDNIINIAYLSNKNTPPYIERFIPLADFAFYVKMKPELIMTRERVPDQGLEYLKAKKRLYDMYETLWNFEVVDGSLSQQALFKKILSKIN